MEDSGERANEFCSSQMLPAGIELRDVPLQMLDNIVSVPGDTIPLLPHGALETLFRASDDVFVPISIHNADDGEELDEHARIPFESFRKLLAKGKIIAISCFSQHSINHNNKVGVLAYVSSSANHVYSCRCFQRFFLRSISSLNLTDENFLPIIDGLLVCNAVPFDDGDFRRPVNGFFGNNTDFVSFYPHSRSLLQIDPNPLIKKALTLYRRFLKNEDCTKTFESLLYGNDPLLSCSQRMRMLSFWLTKLVSVDSKIQQSLLEIESDYKRLCLIIQILEHTENTLNCIQCQKFLAKQTDTVSVGDSDSVGSYINGHGFVHQMTTLRMVTNYRLEEYASIQDTWFPGYLWQIASCSVCNMHIGWLFIADDILEHRLQNSLECSLTTTILRFHANRIFSQLDQQSTGFFESLVRIYRMSTICCLNSNLLRETDFLDLFSRVIRNEFANVVLPDNDSSVDRVFTLLMRHFLTNDIQTELSDAFELLHDEDEFLSEDSVSSISPKLDENENENENEEPSDSPDSKKQKIESNESSPEIDLSLSVVSLSTEQIQERLALLGILPSLDVCEILKNKYEQLSSSKRDETALETDVVKATERVSKPAFFWGLSKRSLAGGNKLGTVSVPSSFNLIPYPSFV